MNRSDVVVGRKYWFRYGSLTGLGVCRTLGVNTAIIVIERDYYPYDRGHGFDVQYAKIVGEDMPVVDEPAKSEDRPVGPRRINLDDGKKIVPKPARRWWEIWRTN